MNHKVIKIFEYALNQEKTGLSFFETSLKRLGVGAAITAFERLIEEEKQHINFIDRILNDLREDREIDLQRVRGVILEPANYFDERTRSEFLDQCLEAVAKPSMGSKRAILRLK